jgi:branched-chain amino acid transport system substrate-binding protein
MTGDGAQQGQYAMIGAQIAADEINAAGGINGQQIKLEAMDDKGDPAEAATVAQRLVDDKSVQVVVGHMWSSATLAAEPIYVKAGMPVLTPTASNIAVTHSGFTNLIRICLNDSIQAPQMAALLVNNLKAKKIAVFYSNDDYGRGLLDQAKKTAQQLGSSVVYEAPYKPGVDKDFTVQLDAAVAAGADSIFLASQQSEGGLIVSQASQGGIFDKIPTFVGNAGLLYQLFLDRVDKTAEDHLSIAAPFDPFADRPVVTSFDQKFAAKENSIPSETAAYSYDALIMIRDAYKAGATRATLVDKIKSMTFTDLVVSGNVSFDKNGDRNEKAMVIVRIKDGKFVSSSTPIDITNVTFDTGN